MAIADQIQSDIKNAMKAGDKERVGALRLVLSELQKAAKDGRDDEVAVLQRERKRRLEAAETYAEAGRDELVAAENQEAKLIESYLPSQLEDGELEQIVAKAIADTRAESVRDMGKVMPKVMEEVKGRASGSRVSGAVKERLQGGV